MATRVFALIIGINNYKSGAIWNLESCCDDAKNVKRWLINDLNVPRSQICLLLDNEATKTQIEDRFMDHLVNNPAIERDDAILIYFAGHGSTLTAPRDWFEGETGRVEVLCPHDHDTKCATTGGRVAGISDRSMHAMLSDLSAVKGSNITLILDCCFTPPFRSRINMQDRQFTRWTPTTKAWSEDLFSGLWHNARGRTKRGFFYDHHDTHILLVACRPGERAMEGPEGGRFTRALLDATRNTAMHRETYAELVNRIAQMMGASQRPLALGQNREGVLFGGKPFPPDHRFVSVDYEHANEVRVDAGAVHGVVEGTEFSVHAHNCHGSANPVLASLRVFEVYSTYALARCTSRDAVLPRQCWARITRWNNRGAPFRVYFKRTCDSVIQRWRLIRQFSFKTDRSPSKGGLNVVRVKRSAKADISLHVHGEKIVVERHDASIAAASRRVVRFDNKPEQDALDVIDDAARFHLHLHRENPTNLQRKLVSMELLRVDPQSWARIGHNLLDAEGRAKLRYEDGAIYSIVMRNETDSDLWPYLAYMDPSGYDINMIYHPEPSDAPPLPKHGLLEVGSGAPGSEALSFSLDDSERLDSGFLKLFVSSIYTSLDIIQQGRPFAVTDESMTRRLDTGAASKPEDTQFWDTALACVTFMKV
ncbi:hypothetical protein PLICRDRAFT_102627 [Plicaturopsis crispa FD-325 SS-3]|nr:hypothetical protein PLICRDRAFT_102627 [Plicaturopsis crispa FD-325 SS-3]